MHKLSYSKEWKIKIDKFLENEITLNELHSQNKDHLISILSYVKAKSKYYSKHLNSLQIPKTYQELDIHSIPFTTKDDLRKYGMDICSLNMDEISTYYETTGTTGTPTPCPRASIDINTSSSFVSKEMKNIYQETFGTTKALTAIMGPSELYAFGDTYGDICHELEIPFVRLWPESPRVGIQKSFELINKLKVKVLICSPAIALALARLFSQNSINIKESSVKQIFVLGELCTDYMLKNISKIWNANCTHGLYGSQEIHALATGCKEGNLHISETNYIVEIIPINNDNKNIGELCVTMIVPGAKPLIRFRTGDIVSINEHTQCKCGRNSRVLKVYGRVDDMILINGKTYLPSDIESYILSNLNEVVGYKFDIKNLDTKEDILIISAITQQKNVDLSVVEAKLSEVFNTKVNLILTNSLDAQTETGAYVSWKFARIRDWRV
ncbi:MULTISPECIES: phenylacetate--CoA ligase family protein [Mammaliicoccus]|uniref:phenylacetate--CoA ligase family protein n=1 Tax=Mammaliicoccus TaxID=2803850 RepID=UPI001EFC29A2|nr:MULTISPECIES: phenylacetate--CoA ligase family protein [Mammaliicoccus]